MPSGRCAALPPLARRDGPTVGYGAYRLNTISLVSEIFTEQFTAVTNLVLASFAVIAGLFGWLAWRGQKIQLRDLSDERNREAAERRQAQAVLVYVYQNPPAVHMAVGEPAERVVQAFLVNSSKQPVFAVQMAFIRTASQVFWQGRTVREAPLLPGEGDRFAATIPVGEDIDDLVAVAFFRDRAGVPWATYSTGDLTDRTPVTVRPPGWIRRAWRWLTKVTGHPRAILAWPFRWVWRRALVTALQWLVRTWPSRLKWRRRSRPSR